MRPLWELLSWAHNLFVKVGWMSSYCFMWLVWFRIDMYVCLHQCTLACFFYGLLSLNSLFLLFWVLFHEIILNTNEDFILCMTKLFLTLPISCPFFILSYWFDCLRLFCDFAFLYGIFWKCNGQFCNDLVVNQMKSWSLIKIVRLLEIMSFSLDSNFELSSICLYFDQFIWFLHAKTIHWYFHFSTPSTTFLQDKATVIL